MIPQSPEPFASAISRWFFSACVLLTLYLAYRLVEPFLIAIFLAVVLVVMADPLYERVVSLCRGRKNLAAGLTCLVLILIIALPFFFIAGVIASQALDLYTTVSNMIKNGHLQELFQENLGRLSPYLVDLQHELGVSQAEVLKEVGELVRQVSNFLYQNLASLLKGVTNLLIGFGLVLFVTYYLFMDGAELAERGLAFSPLPRHLNQQVKQDLLRSLRATMRGTVLLALLQGVADGLGFWIVGVPNALFWGTVMVFASVVPLVGTALVWLPGGLYLLLLGHTWGALGMMVWCALAGLVCDNLLRPRLIGGQANLHPLLTFFSVLGGLSLFGMAGLILGPLILAVLLSLLNIYQRHFLAPPEECPPGPASQP